MTDARQPKNAPMTLHLSGHQVDAIADFARLDGQYMAATDDAEVPELRKKRQAFAEMLAVDLMISMTDVDPASDLAAALRVHQEGHAAYRAAHPEVQ